MKFLKITVLSVFSILLCAYSAFLFILPKLVDFHKYIPQIQSSIEKNTAIKADLYGLNLKTAYNFSLVLSADKVSLKTLQDKKFAQINNIKINLSLIPFLRKEIKIDRIDAEKLMANIDQSLLDFQPPKSSGKTYFKINKTMPDIEIDKYRISFLKGKNCYTLKGNDFEINDFVLNEKINLKTNGKIILNKKEQIKYNVKIFSEVFPQKLKKQKAKEYNIFECFEQLNKYNLKAVLNADLKIRNKKSDVDIEGIAVLDKLSFKLADRILPESSLKLGFKGDKIKINSSFHLDKNSKAIITGIFKTGRNKFVDLHVKSDKIDIENAFSIFKALSASINSKEINNITAKGFLKADFDIKSNFKSIESAGFLRIKNANITYSAQKIALNKINADIDFSQNSIKIKKANALLNTEPITITGAIDKNANADILVFAQNLKLKSLLFALGQLRILNENEISSGLVNLNIVLRGQLKKVSPKVNITATNINLKNKKANAQIKLSKFLLTSQNKKNIAQLSVLKVIPKGQPPIYLPKINLNLNNNNEILIPKTNLYIDNIKTVLSGKISNINSTPTLNPVVIAVSNPISVPIQGYSKSRIIAKGNLNLHGALYNPIIKGDLSIPLISIPTMSVTIKNTTLTAGSEIFLNCPDIKISDSLMNFSSKINKDFANGINLYDAVFNANVIDLNTLGGILKTLPVGTSSTQFNIKNGKSAVAIFKVGGFITSNIKSDFHVKNNILTLNNLKCNAYFGEIAGNINHHIITKKTELKLQGRGLSADTTMLALTGREDDIHGQLNFDNNMHFYGYSKSELLKSLNGNLVFIITNGKMGMLGKFEHLIYAQNVLSNSIFRATLNLALKALTVKDTGVYRYMKGQINIANGWANIQKIKSSGPSMSLYIKGRYHLIDNIANLIILGRISDDIVNILGPIGEFSMNKILTFIPKMGEVTNSLLDQFTTNRNYENISEIPPLTIQTYFPTKEFKVIIDGDTTKQSSVKSFKWISKQQTRQSSNYTKQGASDYQEHLQNPSGSQVPDFVKKLPDFKQ